MGMPVLLDVRHAFVMNMDHSGDMIFSGEAMVGLAARQCERKRRDQYAKQIY